MATNVGKLLRLDGEVALVTGGSRGLGLQLAEALGEAGARVFLTSRKASDLEDAATHLRKLGVETGFAAADAADTRAANTIVAAACEAFGRVDILVNNAGATWGAPAETYPLAAWDKVMNLNIRGVFLMCQAAANAGMIERRRGRIINIASVAGLGGNPREMATIAYNTSKGALVNFTRALAAEWGRHGITVNALAPGFFPTKMSSGLLDAWGADKVAAMAPLNRLGDDDDLKGAAVLFASAAGKHITGQILAVDGGASCVVAA